MNFDPGRFEPPRPEQPENGNSKAIKVMFAGFIVSTQAMVYGLGEALNESLSLRNFATAGLGAAAIGLGTVMQRLEK